jgi:hypothetical protein
MKWLGALCFFPRVFHNHSCTSIESNVSCRNVAHASIEKNGREKLLVMDPGFTMLQIGFFARGQRWIVAIPRSNQTV